MFIFSMFIIIKNVLNVQVDKKVLILFFGILENDFVFVDDEFF